MNIISLDKYKNFDVFHPLLGKIKVTLDDLLNRSTPDATDTIVLAGRFTSSRMLQQKHIRDLFRKLAKPPWTGEDPSLNHLVYGFSAMDLARALMALHPDELLHRLFGTGIKEEFWEVIPKFKTDAHKWLEFSHQFSGMKYRTLGIEKLWCRNWMMSLIKNPNLVIDMPALIGSLDRASVESLGKYINVYREGHIPNYYFRDRVKKSLMDSGTDTLTAVPSAFYDSMCNVQLLNDGLLSYPGVFIGTHSRSGWENLLNAWSCQAGTH